MDKKNAAIKKEEVEYLANLARIALTDTEKEHLAEELGKIIEYVSEISKVEGEKGVITGDITVVNVFREDKVQHSKGDEEIVSGAPEKEDNFFKVPRII